jgi:hypothetical protein
MKRASTWYTYSIGSSWPDLPNGRKISRWLHQFPGKLAVLEYIPASRGIARLTISKFLQNPPSSWLTQHPPAFEQIEYCWPWNIVKPPIDPILFGQLRLSAVERAYNNGCWACQPGKSYQAVRTGEFNCGTSENPYVIAPIEAPSKSAAWKSKLVIFHTCRGTCPTFFLKFSCCNV